MRGLRAPRQADSCRDTGRRESLRRGSARPTQIPAAGGGMRAEFGEGASQLRTGAKRSSGRVHTGVEGGVQDGVQAGCVGRGPGGSRHGWRERRTPGDRNRAALPASRHHSNPHQRPRVSLRSPASLGSQGLTWGFWQQSYSWGHGKNSAITLTSSGQ